MNAYASSPLTTANFTRFTYDNLEDAFPVVNPGINPFGFWGVFQIRRVKSVSRGGVILVAETQSIEHYATQVAKVVSLGPLSFKTIKTVDGVDAVTDWPEGKWFEIGDFVRVPRYGGDRFVVPFEVVNRLPSGDKETVTEQITFCIFKVKDILGLVPDPLSVSAYID